MIILNFGENNNYELRKMMKNKVQIKVEYSRMRILDFMVKIWDLIKILTNFKYLFDRDLKRLN
jgi:hypothetical protein